MADSDIPPAVRRAIENPETALRASKDIGEKAHPDAERVVNARTAIRYVGEDETVPKFQVVTTKLSGFPLGKDMVDVHTLDSVAKWARANDIEEIGVSDEDGFELTEYDADVLRDA